MYGRPVYSKEELSEFIKDFYYEHKRVPRQKDFLYNPDKPSFKQFINIWGSWNNMLLDLGLITDKKRPINKNEHICQNCGKVFYAYGTRKYCSLDCKTEGQRKYESSTSSTNPQSYRLVAFKNYDWKCAVCGYEEDIEYTKGSTEATKVPVILDVHHLDNNRNHNDSSNLVILCPTCHAKIHRGIITISRVEPFKRIKVSHNRVFGGKQTPLNSRYGDLQ